MDERLPFHAGLTVPLDAFYIERQQDGAYIAGLRKGVEPAHCGPHLYGSRQSGKSSLVLRASQQLAADHVVLVVDLAGAFAGRVKTVSDEEFWAGLGEGILFALEGQNGLADDLIGRFAAAVRSGHLYKGLVGLAERLDCPLVLIFDELDVLALRQRAELCRLLRTVLGARAQDRRVRVNVSLVGVLPPVFTDDSPSEHEAVEQVGGKPLWLDDIPPVDSMANEVCRAFVTAKPSIELPAAAARHLLTYSGGYPRALAWLGNCVAREAWDGRLVDGEAFPQWLRELAKAHLPDADAPTAHARHERIHAMAWLQAVEDYFVASAGTSEEGAVVRAALGLHTELLTTDAAGSTPPMYEPDEPRHQLMRFSGLARRDPDGRVRIRSKFFADAFDEEWVTRTEDLVYQRQRAAWARRPRRPGQAKYQSDKRILIIGTGGTVGMAENRAGMVRPGEDHEPPEWVLQAEELLGRQPKFETLFDLDSADVGPEHWTQLSRRIIRAQGDFDGVVVAHGTDTMAYTASAVSFALGPGLSFPVVFTGSQTTAEVLHGDAISNILRATLVATHDLQEVVVVFGEKIFRATRTQKKNDLRFDAFESPGYPELGFVAEEVQIFRQSLMPKSESRGPLMGRSTDFSSGILLVSQMPGAEAAFYEAALNVLDARGESLCKGIIIQSLGAGNIPTVTGAFDLRNLIATANTRSIPVILTSQYPVLPANYTRFSPSDAAIKAGAIPIGNITTSAVVAKLSWVIPQVERAIQADELPPDRRLERIEDMMRDEYVGEGGLTIVAANEEDRRLASSTNGTGDSTLSGVRGDG